MANGDTKTEALLNILGNGGTADKYRGCCNTKTQGYIIDAIDRINAISGVSDFIGTDGTADGVHGLVPAPATTDAGKFLNANGGWEEASSSLSITNNDWQEAWREVIENVNGVPM